MSRYHQIRLSTRQAWSWLALTIVCEVAATLSVKASDGLTRVLPSLAALVGFSLTTLLLAKVVEVIPTSIAYTVWTGSGSVLVALLGIVLFGDRVSAAAWLGITLVIAGVITLNITPLSAKGPSGRDQGL